MTSLTSPNSIMMNINTIDTSENTTIQTNVSFNVSVVNLNIGIIPDINTILHDTLPIENTTTTTTTAPRRRLPPSIIVLSSDDEHDHENSPSNMNNIKASLRNKRNNDKVKDND